MTFNDIEKALSRGEKIYDLPLRVTYYVRVSTDSDVQLNSLDNQLDYYEKFIKSKQNWSYVEPYIEQGVSGTRASTRPSFQRMINDAKKDKFDLIITKEVSRFARDLEDSIHYIRLLKENNVGVFFENQNLNTFDSNSELILNIMFNLAQDESKKLSLRVKFGFKQAISNGHVLGSSNITGYKKDNCKLVVVPEEAKFINILFSLYATGEYGFYKLALKLYDMGYKNKRGGIYDKDTLKRMIINPKYKGYYRSRVHETIDYRTKKRKTNPLEEQVIYKCEDGSIPPIVSEELWDKANSVLKARTEGYGSNNYWSGGVKYSLSSKIFCKEHNVNFQHSHGNRRKKRPIWACGKYLNYRITACASPIIAEVDINNIINNIINSIIPDKSSIINNMLKIYENINCDNEYSKELDAITQTIQKFENKKTFVLDLAYEGELNKDSLKEQLLTYNNEINKLNDQKNDILSKIELVKNSKNNVQKMSKLIEDEISSGSLDEFTRKFVHEIIVSKIDNDRNNIKLDIYLNLNGIEIPKKRGAYHIDGPTPNDSLYIKNNHCDTIETKRSIDTPNQFTYDVYIETF